MKKLRINNLFIFLLGLSCLSLGVVLVIKSNLGVSVATSVPYVISLYFTKITFGQWNYIVHGFVLLLLVIIIRRLTIKYLMSFIVAFLFGIAIDLFNLILASVTANTFVERIGLFTFGSIVISIGVAAFIKSNYPILPFDTFVKEICLAKNIEIAKFKTGFDLVCFTVSLTFSIIFFGKIKGLHIGTLVSAIILGSMIGECLKIMNKYIEGKSIFPEEKAKLVLDFDFLNFNKSKGLKKYN
ncbi:hypothetical protein KQI88_17645 [Alkaliphilus sp. MSJ-5]|uniref:Membrane protein YczE n=1 Tax=Alkaliphilus flagellatus TaxID=2841507 RepID=A0ABS6G7X3_9FIRM|nr:DUF6198 family protein [Alkaliphilus flagellatus]MBU5678236.1 hypothetical protein [Alkaliphilus flagellatus]